VGLSFYFQQDNELTHLQAVLGLFDQEREWWSAASDDLSSIVTQSQPNWDSLGWVQKETDEFRNCSEVRGHLEISLFFERKVHYLYIEKTSNWVLYEIFSFLAIFRME
jgi:hypothetical protein